MKITTTIRFLGSGFGLGYFKFFPGTLGALLGWPIILLALHMFSTALYVSLFLLMICFILFGVSYYILPSYNTSDPKQFVLDEIVGFLFTTSLLPCIIQTDPFNIKMIWLSFAFFRICDILKLPGARWVDKNMHNWLGVNLDDIIAGLYAIFFMSISIKLNLL